MSLYLSIGTKVVVLALIAYTFGIIAEQKLVKVTRKVLMWLSLGVFFDIFATVCMILGSPNSPFTFHGFLGYSALLMMVTDTVLLWRLRFKNEINTDVPRKLHVFSRYAYIWWVIAFVVGALMVLL